MFYRPDPHSPSAGGYRLSNFIYQSLLVDWCCNSVVFKRAIVIAVVKKPSLDPNNLKKL